MADQIAPLPGNDSEEPSEPMQITLTVEQDGTYDVDGEPYPTIREALLAIVKIVRENPVADNAQGDMEAGYRAEGGPMSGQDAGGSGGNAAQSR